MTIGMLAFLYAVVALCVGAMAMLHYGESSEGVYAGIFWPLYLLIFLAAGLFCWLPREIKRRFE